MESFQFVEWGITDYAEAYERQKLLFEEALEAKSRQEPVVNTLIFCEHSPVITIGKSGKTENLLFPEQELAAKGVSLYKVDRGGDVTFHGPGQLVGYPVFDLENLGIGLKEYISKIEEAIISLLQMYDIRASRMEGATGVWIDVENLVRARKICAIGVRSSRYVTMHGFALNVNTDLDYFRLINPCGFVDKGVTSMENECGKAIDISEVSKKLHQIFHNLFCR